jgi:hypothetical protein
MSGVTLREKGERVFCAAQNKKPPSGAESGYRLALYCNSKRKSSPRRKDELL